MHADRGGLLRARARIAAALLAALLVAGTQLAADSGVEINEIDPPAAPASGDIDKLKTTLATLFQGIPVHVDGKVR